MLFKFLSEYHTVSRVAAIAVGRVDHQHVNTGSPYQFPQFA